MQITQKRALAIAKALGYTGGDAASDVSKFLADADQMVKISESPTAISTKALLVNQADAKSVTVTQIDDGEEMAEESYAASAKKSKTLTADDVDAIVKSRIDDVAKQFAARPSLEVTGGESVEHVLYNDLAKDGKTAFKNAKTAEIFLSMAVLKSGAGNRLDGGAEIAKNAKETLKKFAPDVHKDYSTGVGSVDVLVAPLISGDIIRLFNSFGDMASVSNVITSANDQEVIRYRNMTETRAVTYPNENTTVTTTDTDFRAYATRLRMAMLLSKVSLSALKFSRLSLADEIATDFARDFAYAEDNAALNGDGTSTYGGNIGVLGQFAAIGVGSAAGATVGGANWGAHTLDHFATLMGLLPRYAARRNPVFVCSQAFYETCMMKLARAAGGVTMNEVAAYAGEAGPRFCGRPVVTCELMNQTSAAAANTIDCLYGDFSLGLDLVRGGGVQIETDLSSGFTTASANVRGLFWHGIQAAHGIGTTSARGPIVALYQS